MARAAAKKKPANKKAKTAPKKISKLSKKISRSKAASSGSNKLTFNHAMIYATNVAASLDFYRGLLGFKLVDEFRYEGRPVYARLCAPGGDGTIALHQAEPQ